MDHIVCSVVYINRRWFVDCGGTRHGPYMSVETATLVARSEARALSGKKQAVKVSVQDENGRISNEFFLGPEPEPACK